MAMQVPKLVIVIPCYNEEAVLPVSSPLFADELSGRALSAPVGRDRARGDVVTASGSVDAALSPERTSQRISIASALGFLLFWLLWRRRRPVVRGA